MKIDNLIVAMLTNRLQGCKRIGKTMQIRAVADGDTNHGGRIDLYICNFILN